MYNILALNKISDRIFSVFDNEYSVDSSVENPDAIIVRSYKMHDMEFGDSLLAVARAGAGTNNIPTPILTEKGVVVFNTPGANANGVKELVICGMLMAARNVLPACKWTESIKDCGCEVPSVVEKGKSNYVGTEIFGKTLGLIGLGAIGAKVAESAHALGMKIIGYDPYLDDDIKTSLSSFTKFVDSLDDIYAFSDFISLHTPLLDSTRFMINKNSISKMKDGVIILNMARGELVNNADIDEALCSNKVRAYVVDFPTAESLCCKNVIAIPHLGASTEESEENCAYMAASQLKEYLENGNIINSINFPKATFPRKPGTVRLAIAYNNVCEAKEQLLAIVNESSPSTVMSNTNKNVGYILAESDGFNEDVIDKLTENLNAIFIRIL